MTNPLSFCFYLLFSVSVETTVEQVLFLIFYHIVFFMFVWSYWQTVFTSIGKVPPKVKFPPDLFGLKTLIQTFIFDNNECTCFFFRSISFEYQAPKWIVWYRPKIQTHRNEFWKSLQKTCPLVIGMSWNKFTNFFWNFNPFFIFQNSQNQFAGQWMAHCDTVTNAWWSNRIERITAAFVECAFSKWIIIVHGYVCPMLLLFKLKAKSRKLNRIRISLNR